MCSIVSNYIVVNFYCKSTEKINRLYEFWSSMDLCIYSPRSTSDRIPYIPAASPAPGRPPHCRYRPRYPSPSPGLPCSPGWDPASLQHNNKIQLYISLNIPLWFPHCFANLNHIQVAQLIEHLILNSRAVGLIPTPVIWPLN